MSTKGSVFQKGGGGTNFEQLVQTAFLTTLIIQGNAPCLPANKIIEVSFQNTNKGYETDDILVVAKSALGQHRLLMQIKHDISFTIGNRIFKEDVIQPFWKDYNNTLLFDKINDKLIIIKNGLTKDERNHLKSLFNWANTHATEVDFISEVNRIKGKKEYLDIFRKCLKEVNNNVDLTDKELWEFLKCLDVLEYDFLNQGSVDETYFLNLIRLSKNKESILNEKEIWNDILAFTTKLNKDGGNATVGSIQKEELYKNFAIEKLNPYFKAVEKLKSDSIAILKPMKNTIGDLHFNRIDTKEAIVNSVNTFQFTIVTGKPGVGKSAEIKNLLQNNFPGASMFVFRADQFNQPHIANVFSNQGVNDTVQDIFSCISLIPDKILFIDSLEKLLEVDPEYAFKQLLALLKEFTDIKIIASSRKYAIDLIIQKFGLNKDNLAIVELLPLNNDELNIVSKKFPQLTKVLKNSKIKVLLQSPKYLDFAITALYKTADDYSEITLTNFKNKLWDLLVVDTTVTKNGLPLKREKAFMNIAVKRAKGMKLFVKADDLDEEAILMLEKDEIIFQEHQNRKYAPAHDILEDWALVRYVSAVYEDYTTPNDLFKNLGNEPAIRRAFRLWVEDCLLDNSKKVHELIKATLNDNLIERYWADELLVAIFKSEYSYSFFALLEKELLNNNASLLNRCLHLIKTCCKESNLNNNNFSLLLPIGSGWKEVLFFIKKYITQLDILRLPIVSFLFDWHYRLLFQYTTIDNEELSTVKAIVIHYINQIEEEQDFWQETYTEDKAKDLVSILFDLAAISKEEIKLLIERAYINEEKKDSWKLNSFYKSVIDKCISGLGNQRLIKEIPELVIETAWKEWKSQPIEEPRPGSIAAMIGPYTLRSDRCWGIEDKFHFFPSGIYKTPAYNLLCYHPLKGLQFITEFINYAVDFYIKADFEYKHEFKQIEIQLNDGTKITQWLSQELWLAYRGLSVTHYAIECLLISLEKFLLEMADKKTEISKSNLKFTFDYLLKESNNVATSSVLVSVAIAYPNEVGEAMLPLLSVREFYELDLNRALQESNAFCPVDDRISFAQEERWKSNELSHRKKYRLGLRDFILDYQFNIRKLNKDIHGILDKLKDNIPPEDIVWKKAMTEIDIRNHKTGKYDEKLGGFPIQPEYDKEVIEFMDSNKEDFEAQRKSIHYSNFLLSTLKAKETIEFSTWEICYKKYSSSEDFNTYYDRPVTLAALGIQYFLQIINEQQREWCIETITNTIINILKRTLSRDYTINTEYNLMEKEIALSSFHLLFSIIDNDKDKDGLIILMIYMLFSPFADHEIRKITTYIRTIFFKHYPMEGKIVWYGLIQYAQFRKSNPYFYDDHNNDRLQSVKEKEEAFIRNIVQTKKLDLDFSEINLQSCEGYLLARAFVITPYYITDVDVNTFIQHFIPLLTEDLKQKEDYSYNRRGQGRQIVFQTLSDLKVYLAELLLKANSELAKSVLDLILNPIYQNNISVRKRKDDLFEFASDVLEYIIYKLDDILTDSTDKTAETPLISNFWALWEYLFLRIKESGKLYFINTLFLDIRWNKDSVHWSPLEGKKEFYYEMINEFGIHKIQSILNVFSTIGEKLFLPNGLNLLVDIYKKDDKLTNSLMSTSAERLIKRLFYNHISEIKNNQQLINNLIWLLNKMVDLGSSEAYLFRENVITYKQVK